MIVGVSSSFQHSQVISQVISATLFMFGHS